MIEIARTLHLLGVVFWVGGMGARLLLLGSVTAETPESVRGQLYEAQRRVHLRMEVPAFLIALLAGLFLMYAAGVTFRQTWFSMKVLLLVGVIFVDLLASRRFRAIRASGDAGGAAGLTSALVVLALLMVFAAVTKF
jgi:uncharacterized membrane protein